MYPQHGAVWLHDWCTNAAGTVLDDNMMGAVCRVLMTGVLGGSVWCM